MRVLLFSNDLMPFSNLPTSGGGLRCWQLMKGLEAHGVEVLTSMPGFTYLAEKHLQDIPKEQRELLWRWETQDEILRRTKPDAVLFASNWDHFNLSQRVDIPIIIDLHGSRLIETTMFNEPASTERKVQIFNKADCLLAAGKRQRKYFYGWLIQAGRVPKDEHFIRYIPVSLAKNTPSHRYPSKGDQDAPFFVSGGGWFPWQNQAKAIFAIAKAVSEKKRGRIEIFGTPHQLSRPSAEQLMIEEVYAKVKSFSEQSPRVCVSGYIGRQELLEKYRQASVAVELMRYNLERELAFTTRTIEYLWCGLPVLYNNFSEVGEHIAAYDAGWTLDPESDQELEKTLDEIFSQPEVIERKGLNAQRLVRERFAWDKTIAPLLEFLNHPQKAEMVEPADEPIVIRSSFMCPSGTTLEIQLGKEEVSLRQPFIVPAEDIKTVQISVSLSSKEQRGSLGAMELRLFSVDGKSISRKRFSPAQFPVNGHLGVDFPLLKRPQGGEHYELQIKYFGAVQRYHANGSEAGDGSVFSLKGLMENYYPLLPCLDGGYKAKTLLGQDVEAKSIALSFATAGGKLYRLKSLSERIMWMVRQRQWRNLWTIGQRKAVSSFYKLTHR